MIQQLSGPEALTPFRNRRLLSQLRQICPAISGLRAEFVHLVETEKTLDERQQSMLAKVLDYGDPSTTLPGLQSVDCCYFCVPRAGTISPWSSKATEIARHCGLDSIIRLERGIQYQLQLNEGQQLSPGDVEQIMPLLHDRMTEQLLADAIPDSYFQHPQPVPLQRIPLLEEGRQALVRVNRALGLGLSDEELDYLEQQYRGLQRDPSDVELMMFAQANSEHCRHKIFNAEWVIDGEAQEKSLFSMIRNTSEVTSEGILSAYSDNAAVVEGHQTRVFLNSTQSRVYHYVDEPAHLLMKVETHNHPTAIAPFPGAATGCGGEIRDEGATGRGSRSKAGLTGFTVSNLRIPGFEQPWEQDFGKPGRMASALDIMLEGPIGGAAFNNEFGRPNLAGYFRTFEQEVPGSEGAQLRGFHKPIMIAGGMGTVRPQHVLKQEIAPGTPIVVLGGPAMLIGLGGGAASSQDAGTSSEELDFASVQRGNPEMQRRCQEVISACCAMGEDTPIISIHDVGAGGLSNAVPEIINDCKRGGHFSLDSIPTAEAGLSPLQLWCNEAQERYILALRPDLLAIFEQICEREQCPYAVLGTATDEARLLLEDELKVAEQPIDLPMSLLFGNTPRLQRDASHQAPVLPSFTADGIDLAEAVTRVLRFPAVASKQFLITIGDRSVGGLVARDQMVGPWQVPVADVAVTCSGFQAYTGEAMAIGEKSPIAVIDAAASGRMAVGEALTNLMMAPVERLSQIKLSANWMAAAGADGQDADLYDTVRAVGMELCPALGIAIPVGKDSLSMRTLWQSDQGERSMTSPLSVVISAFAPVSDVRKTLTPELITDQGDSVLLLLDLGKGADRLGGSALAQVYGGLGDCCPDLDDPEQIKQLFSLVQKLNGMGLILAAHDRSDGGLLACLCEMAFAARTGVTINLPDERDAVASLFAEELGLVIQVAAGNLESVETEIAAAGLAGCCLPIATLNDEQTIVVQQQGKPLFRARRGDLLQEWSGTSYQMQALRDNSDCAEQEFERLAMPEDRGLHAELTFDLAENIAAPFIHSARPRIAILREQGVNGQVEMAAAFDRAGFTSVDVHMSDIARGEVSLSGFAGLAVCGGFSYGDVLGAGGGWSKSILLHDRIRDEFAAFFARQETFGLGVCNGCQMLSALRDLIPGAAGWPAFVRNMSEQFEARLAMVEVTESRSILLQGMQGSRMPVVVAHGEGRATYAHAAINPEQVALRYVDSLGQPTEHYPENPNGSPAGITGVTNEDGRFTIMMPHPERCFRTVQHSWHPRAWGEDAPWLRMFRNARVWLG